MAKLKITIISVIFAFASTAGARASEITVWTQRSIATVLTEVGPKYEQETGHKLKVTYDLTANFVQRMDAGEAFDILVSGVPRGIDALVRRGKIVADTRTALVRSGIGMEVRAGAPKPDISSVDAFKRALLNAKSIGYLPAGSGACCSPRTTGHGHELP
jgi:molybdate transport system substrate-binding protein